MATSDAERETQIADAANEPVQMPSNCVLQGDGNDLPDTKLICSFNIHSTRKAVLDDLLNKFCHLADCHEKKLKNGGTFCLLKSRDEINDGCEIRENVLYSRWMLTDFLSEARRHHFEK